VSYETYELAKDIVVAHALPPIFVKGVTRDVVPYVIECPAETAGEAISAHAPGLELKLDLEKIDDVERVSEVLRNAMAALARRSAASAAE
jgi:hypothetical protein